MEETYDFPEYSAVPKKEHISSKLVMVCVLWILNVY